MYVEKSRMEASARTTCRFLGLQRGDSALLCMPLDYIAGKMMAVRAAVWGLHLIDVKPSGHPLAGLAEAPVFAAMVPMQAYNSMQVDAERKLMAGIRHLIIGGGAIDSQLAEQLKELPGCVWSTYGMTETLSHIALRRVNGAEASEWYTPFDGVRVSADADGCLVIDAPDVCPTLLHTNDIVQIAGDGRRFRIRGRHDNVICSGGLKLQIEEMEARLKPHLDHPFVITKQPDAKFGETPVLLTTDRDTEKVATTCRQWLGRYEQPHCIMHVGSIPTTETGKPARAEAQRIANDGIRN